MNTLVIDTSSDLEFIAVSTGDDVTSRCEHIPLSHSVSLLQSIDNLLHKQGITIHDIDILGVGTGPGSFTGIRIAVSTMRMMSQMTGKPLVGIPTPLLYAISIKSYGKPGDRILIALDARKDRIFGAVYSIVDGDNIPRAIVPPGDHKLEDLLDADCRTLIAAGSGVIRFKERIMRPGCDLVIPDLWLDGKVACGLVYQTWEMEPGRYSDPLTTVPLYIRKSDAETARGK